MTAQPPQTAEGLFAEFLDRLEQGEVADFDRLCGEHPSLAPALRRVHASWQAMSEAFDELSQDGGVGAEVDPQVTPGGRLARYVLGAELARGAMGKVVRGWDEELRREVALKIHRGGLGDGRAQRRFVDEARIVAGLEHPGIVPVHELGEDGGGRPFFAMQLVRGRDLGQVLAAVRAGDAEWTRTRVLSVLLRVCEAMAYAHDKGVVHRDLKPQNIMVGRFGETYVMDWGLARVVGARTDESTDDGDSGGDSLATRDGDVLGTPAYMAPEQAAGARLAAPAVDVYSVGAILYHLLAGAAPYAGAKNADAVLAALRERPPVPLPDDVPVELRAIQERAMARAPAERYPTMLALADDLRAFLEVRTVSAYEAGRFAELRKWVARNRRLTVALAAFVFAVVVGVIATTVLWVRADDIASLLRVELDRSAFRSARQALQIENSVEAGAALWRTHLAGGMPRATAWALRELAERDPYLATLPIHHYGVPVAHCPAADAVLIGDRDGVVQLRDPSDLSARGELLAVDGVVTSLAVSVDGAVVVVGSSLGEVVVFDAITRRDVMRRVAHRDNVRHLVTMPGGAFASAGADGLVLWWAGPRAEPRELLRFDSGVTALVAHPRGDGAVAGDNQGHLRGAAHHGRWRFGLTFPGKYITAIAFGPSEQQLWIGGTDAKLHHVDFSDRRRDRVVPTRNGTCRQLLRDDDGTLLVGGWWRTDRLRADDSLVPVALRDISRLSLDARRRRLVTSGQHSGIGLVDLLRRDRRSYPGAELQLSADGSRIALRRGDRVEVRAVVDDALLVSVAAPDTTWLRLDGSGQRLLLGVSGRSEVQLVDVVDGASRTLPIDGGLLRQSCFAPDDETVLLCVDDGRLLRVQVADGRLLGEYRVPAPELHQSTCSADGRWLAVICRREAIVHLLEFATGVWHEVPFVLPLPPGVAGELSSVALSADGGTIAVGTWNGAILVRDAAGAVTALAGHAGTVWSLQFAAADGGLLFSSGGAQGIAGWDVATGECCYQAVLDEARTLQIDAGASTLVCAVPGGSLLLDLGYYERHIAGSLEHELQKRSSEEVGDAARVATLRAWAAGVLARPWPRLR
ncbi:MAG: protein kinase [Planctomycetes bacterium]|nr:protein kinase [Planctomycetota bacterium]